MNAAHIDCRKENPISFAKEAGGYPRNVNSHAIRGKQSLLAENLRNNAMNRVIANHSSSVKSDYVYTCDKVIRQIDFNMYHSENTSYKTLERNLKKPSDKKNILKPKILTKDGYYDEKLPPNKWNCTVGCSSQAKSEEPRCDSKKVGQLSQSNRDLINSKSTSILNGFQMKSSLDKSFGERSILSNLASHGSPTSFHGKQFKALRIENKFDKNCSSNEKKSMVFCKGNIVNSNEGSFHTKLERKHEFQNNGTPEKKICLQSRYENVKIKSESSNSVNYKKFGTEKASSSLLESSSKKNALPSLLKVKNESESEKATQGQLAEPGLAKVEGFHKQNSGEQRYQVWKRQYFHSSLFTSSHKTLESNKKSLSNNNLQTMEQSFSGENGRTNLSSSLYSKRPLSTLVKGYDTHVKRRKILKNATSYECKRSRSQAPKNLLRNKRSKAELKKLCNLQAVVRIVKL